MLSRTANSLFWLARYMERMDYQARLTEVGQHTASMMRTGLASGTEWHSTIIAAGVEEPFRAKHGEARADAVIDYLVRDLDNPSSIRACVERARFNARSVRGALTRDTWAAINGTWLELQEPLQDFPPSDLPRMLEQVRERATLFFGAYNSTMLKADAYHFMRLGTFLERLDNTARILDVKYHILLPDHAAIGGALDYHQWSAILRAVSAQRIYQRLYADQVRPWKVAELLILRPEMPRSLRFAMDEITASLDALGSAYGGRYGECHRLAGEMHARLKFNTIDKIFTQGMHEFLTAYVDQTIDLGEAISDFYLF